MCPEAGGAVDSEAVMSELVVVVEQVLECLVQRLEFVAGAQVSASLSAV